jgi:RNA polymerase sigma-70 factor (ECF subfamily)
MNAETLFRSKSGAQSEDDTAHQVIQLYEEHAAAICTYLHFLTKEWDLAHDLTQETFLRLFRSRNQLPAIQNPRA